MKEYRATFKSPDGMQYMRLYAKNEEEAERLALEQQFRRKARFDLTFHRLDQSLERGDISKAIHKAQQELRKADQGRSEEGKWKLVKVEAV